jgi:aminoglycoside phosphotransferase (APT) family kinase protein
MSDHFQLIPEQHRAAVQTACSTVFGAADLQSLQHVRGGFSAQIFKLQLQERPYLLRIDTARSPLHNLQRSYSCMQTAEAAGIAPALHYADATTGVSIMDFIDARPLSSYPGGNEQLLRDLGALIARLQTTPVFPQLADYIGMVKRMVGMLNGTLFAAGLLDSHLSALERIQAAYPWASVTPVSSHNDPNPGNILYDGERLWLIDWETAFCNDPLVDLAIIANNFAQTTEAQTVLLQSWLGTAPSDALRSRLFLMRLCTHLYYGSIVLVGLARTPGLVPHTSLDALTPTELQQAVAQGQLKWGSAETTIAFAKIFFKAFSDGVVLPQFDQALITAQT